MTTTRAQATDAARQSVMTPAAKLMAALTGLALLDLAATGAGLFNGQPGGDSSYAVFAAATTAAVWLLAVGKALVPARPTGLARLVQVAAVAGLQAQAVIAAVRPVAAWPVRPEAATPLAIVLILGAVASLFLRES